MILEKSIWSNDCVKEGVGDWGLVDLELRELWWVEFLAWRARRCFGAPEAGLQASVERPRNGLETSTGRCRDHQGASGLGFREAILPVIPSSKRLANS